MTFSVFFVSGPNPSGGSYVNKNIALIPGTSTPVAINNINNGRNNAGPCTNCRYYIVNNQNTIQYDGFTTVLTAVLRVTPCQTYHIKIAIGDAGDAAVDSGVLLEENSFSSNTITTDISYSINGLTQGAIEGCNNASISFSIPAAKPYPFIIHYTILGNATNGVDYVHIPDSVVIPTGYKTVTRTITPYMDTLVESTEYVTLRYVNTLCTQTIVDSVRVLIYNKYPFITSFCPDKSICYGHADSIYVGASGGISPYTYNWSNTTSNISGMMVNPTTTTNYIISVTDKCNSSNQDTITISVKPKPTVVFSVNDTDQCSRGNSFIFSNSSSISPSRSLSYNWAFGDNSNSTTTNPTHVYTSPGTYTVRLVTTSGEGCFDSVKRKVYVYPSPVAGFSINDSTQCFTANQFAFNNSSSIGSGSMAYLWHFGDNNTSSSANPRTSLQQPGHPCCQA